MNHRHDGVEGLVDPRLDRPPRQRLGPRGPGDRLGGPGGHDPRLSPGAGEGPLGVQPRLEPGPVGEGLSQLGRPELVAEQAQEVHLIGDVAYFDRCLPGVLRGPPGEPGVRERVVLDQVSAACVLQRGERQQEQRAMRHDGHARAGSSREPRAYRLNEEPIQLAPRSAIGAAGDEHVTAPRLQRTR